MPESSGLPLIGIPACVRQFETGTFHAVQERYVKAVRRAVGGAPLILPALGWDVAEDGGPGLGIALDAMLDMLDGVLLTGSPSNVEPRHYGTTSREGVKHDPQRDATTLPLIRRAIERAVPLLAICRGIQELNVALGGSLHQHVHELPGKMDHRSQRDRPIDERYAPRHPVELTPDGWLAKQLGCTSIMVNSLHGQGIDRLAPGLAVEATAEDGMVEAVRPVRSPAFALGVQWHPEYHATESPISRAIFQAFGDACRERAAQRRMNAAA